MTPLQIYCLTWTPSFILLFVLLGPYAMLAFFIPTFIIAVAHHKGMSISMFIPLVCWIALGLLAMFTVIPDLL